MDRITFTVNGEDHSVGSEIDSDVSVNDYLRNHLNLRGTKHMCKEGGCGSCIVAATTTDHDGVKRTYSISSCLVSITSCQDWEITTIEGLGDRGRGYHPLQKVLAKFNGTQCGFCSPGWIMNMYSLLEAKDYKMTQYEIENSVGCNTCRCTGYRPILDAFKSLATDAPKQNIDDIEDLKVCKQMRNCNKTCSNSEWCYVDNVGAKVKKINLKDNSVWYRVNEIDDVFDVLDTDDYMFVNGNTGKGVVPIFAYPKLLIDIQPIKELKGYFIDQNLDIGAGTTLNELMNIFKTVAQKHEEFSYLQKLYDHLDLVATVPIRNIGTVAGNLMSKHKEPKFPSDIFLLLETVGATLTILSSKTNKIDVTPEAFLKLDMNRKLMTRIKLPPLSKQYQFVSFKIMPRSQNAVAQVNAGFMYKIKKDTEETVDSARIVIGGLSPEFVHATKTEEFLINKKLFVESTLQQALKILQKELIVKELPPAMKAEYRRKVALSLFYKSLLVLIPRQKLGKRYHSGAEDLRKTRPLSKGSCQFDTNKLLWPLNEPMPKIEALIQTSGEAKYANDMPTLPHEVFCAFVTAKITKGEIVDIDPSPALEIPGVLAFLSAKDIPGSKFYISIKVLPQFPEELFADKMVKYFDQPIGIIVAETDKIANRAAKLVHVKYKPSSETPILTIEEAQKNKNGRDWFFFPIPAFFRGIDVYKKFEGKQNIFAQCHYPMETMTAITRPSDDGIEITASAQWLNLVHVSVAELLGLPQNRVDIKVPRCGGSFGQKITRMPMVAAASALTTYMMNRPCRFVISFESSVRSIGKRMPALCEYEGAVNESGKIQYLKYKLHEDNGYTFGDLVVFYALGAVKSCYDRKSWDIQFYNAFTDTPSNTFARAPGTMEATAMTETIMERISYELDLDPVDVRLNNISLLNLEMIDLVKHLTKSSDYEKRKKNVAQFNKDNRWKKRGIKVAIMSWPVVTAIEYNIMMSVYHGDGSIVIKHGGIEIGQGINTKLMQVVAYTLKIPLHKIRVKPCDTTSNPNNFSTANSRTTQTVCIAAIKCCQILLDRLLAIRDLLTEVTWELLVKVAHLRGINLQVNYKVTPNDIQTYRVEGGAITEVELDILTGEHVIRRVDIYEDCGTSVNPALDIGQIEGAFIFGMGYWTCEHLINDEHTGEIYTNSTSTYHVPLAKDIPLDFRIKIKKNSYNPKKTLGSKAVGEPPSCLAISVAFALRAAIVASREDTGFRRTDWFDVDGPFTLETNVLKSMVRLNEFQF